MLKRGEVVMVGRKDNNSPKEEREMVGLSLDGLTRNGGPPPSLNGRDGKWRR